MNIPQWKWRSIIFLSYVINLFISTDGRRYDKCETPDGRLGVCVVKRYCRERTVQTLLQCDDDGNFCCPIQANEVPATSPIPFTTAQPPYFAEVPKHTRTTPVYKDQNQRQLYNNRQTPSRTYDKSEKDSALKASGDDDYARKQYEEFDNKTDSVYYKPEVHSRPQLPDTRDFQIYNNKPDDYSRKQYDERVNYKPEVPPRPLVPDDHDYSRKPYDERFNYKPEVLPQPQVPHNYSYSSKPYDERANYKPEVPPRSIVPDDRDYSRKPHDERVNYKPEVPPRPVVPDDRDYSRKPYDERVNYKPEVPPRPVVPDDRDYSRKPNDERVNNKPEVPPRPLVPDDRDYSHKPYDERVNYKPEVLSRPLIPDENDPSRKPNDERVNYKPEIPSRSHVPDLVEPEIHNDKQDTYDSTHKLYDENEKRIVTINHRPEVLSRPQAPDTGDFKINGNEQGSNRRQESGPTRTIKFDPSPTVIVTEMFESTTKRPPRVLFPVIDSSMQNSQLPGILINNVRKTENTPDTRHDASLIQRFGEDERNDRKITSTPEPKTIVINANSDLRPQVPSVAHYPSRDQFEVQKLPSNPRRLRPLRYDNTNETDHIQSDHKFFSKESSLPKVPSCGVKPYDLFIAGGETSQPHEWPWMTAIFRRHQGSRPKTFLCGGSLINTKYVLTAAHCFVNNYVILPVSSFVIRLGSHFLDNGEEYTVEDLVIHHNHSGQDFFNDIALVRIASEVYVTDKIAPICLPTPDMMSQNFVERLATVAGWGDTTFRTGASRALQHVAIPIVSSDECFAAYSRVRGAAFLARGSDHVICAGLREGGKDACLGDSGGPLMLKSIDDRWTIVGIVSLGYKCAEPGYPGVYTRVTHYLSWIQANMKMP